MRFNAIGLGLCLALSALPALAVDSLTVSLGALDHPRGEGSVNDGRISAGWVINQYESDSGLYQTRMEVGVGYSNTQADKVWSVTVAPVAHYRFKTSRPDSGPFVEASLGGAYLSKIRFADDHDLTSHGHFASRLGVGYAFGASEVSLNATHFSNAGIKKPNPGVNVIALRFTRLL